MGLHPSNQAIELTPRPWKEDFADTQLRSNRQRPSSHTSEQLPTLGLQIEHKVSPQAKCFYCSVLGNSLSKARA